MTGAELIAALQDPAVREPVQRLLGLPSEPVAEALKELAAAQRSTRWGSGVGSDGRPVTVLCEVKSRIYGQDVKTFRRRVDRLSADLGVRPVAVMFGFRVHPTARAIARELDVRVWASVPHAA